MQIIFIHTCLWHAAVIATIGIAALLQCMALWAKAVWPSIADAVHHNLSSAKMLSAFAPTLIAVSLQQKAHAMSIRYDVQQHALESLFSIAFFTKPSA